MSEQLPRNEVSRFVDVDVSKDKLDVRVIPGGELSDFANNAEGTAKLVALWLENLPPA